MSNRPVRAWQDWIVLPSYLLDGYDRHPHIDEIFGKYEQCYPYPYASLRGDRRKVRQKYLAVHLENEFLEVICFPHFGGRIYSCRDKITGQDIFHPVEQVSVAFLNGTSGGTYSGCGVEISFPDHHSITNTRKREYQTLRHDDGSATIVMSELELRMRMRWEAHLTLRPGVARLEQEVRVHNRTLMYGRGRYWGNASMHHTPSLHVSYPECSAYEHGGEYGVASWPVYDGVDMRRPSNVPHPVGLEMKDVRQGHYAYYDQDRRFGMVHWASPDEAPGKKYWTWGSSAHTRHRAHWFADGQDFLELQSGRCEDQEDYELYPPFCLKRWREFWYPIRDLGPVDAAGPDVALSCAPRAARPQIALCATVAIPKGEIRVFDGKGRLFATRAIHLAAAETVQYEVPFPRGDEFRVAVLRDGKPLTTFFHRNNATGDTAIDRVAVLAGSSDAKTADDLMMQCERQLRYFPRTWKEQEAALQKVLQTDPNHAAAHRWMGIWLLRRQLVREAQEHLEKAVQRQPCDGEAYFYKGLCLMAQGEATEAEWQLRMAFRHNQEDRAGFMLGLLFLRQRRVGEAIEWLNACVDANGNNLRGRLYRALALAKQGRQDAAKEDVAEVRRRMPSEALATVVEQLIRVGSLRGFLRSKPGRALAVRLRQDVQTWLELVCDLMAPGLFREALELTGEIRRECRREPGAALVNLYRGYLLDQLGKRQPARQAFTAALQADRAFVFPFRDEEEAILNVAARYAPRDGVVEYYRALLRGKQARCEEAFAHGRTALRYGLKDPVLYRLMAAIARKRGNLSEAESLLDRALAMDSSDVDIRGDLLRLVKTRNDRRKFRKLTQDPALASTRLVEEIVNFRVAVGDCDGAVETIAGNARFPNSCQDYYHLYELALHVRAFQCLRKGELIRAEKDLRQSFKFPAHLGPPVGKVRTHARGRYLLGLALRGQGRAEEARRIWEEALQEQESAFWLPGPGWGYGVWIDRYWQGRILLELGRTGEAQAYFEGLLAYAQNKSPALCVEQRQELYTLGRAGTARSPVESIITQTEFLALE